MKLHVYSVKDTVANEFGPIWQAVNDGVAKRQFRHILDSTKGVRFDDFELWRLAEFYKDSGEIVVDKPQVVMYGFEEVQIELRSDILEESNLEKLKELENEKK